MADYFKMPDVLPQQPSGWKRQLHMHLNFGGGKKGGGAATYQIENERGEVMPFAYQYDTRPGGMTGFTLPGVKLCMSWEQLRGLWPKWIARARKKQKARADG